MLSTDMFSGVKMVKNAFAAGPRWGSSQCHPRPLAGLWGRGRGKGYIGE